MDGFMAESSPDRTMTPKETQAWWVDRPGDINAIRLKAISLEDLKDDQVRVKVRAIGLNFADVFTVLGLYEAAPKRDFVPGLEVAGTIDAVGKDVTDYKIGDQVLAVTRFGGFIKHLDIDHHYVRPLPEGYSFSQAAALPCQGLTAYYGLYRLGNLTKDKSVLVHSVAGGVGLLAADMIRKTGGLLIGTVGNYGPDNDKTDFLINKFGLKKEQIITRADSGVEFGQQLKEAMHACGMKPADRFGNGGFDIVFDSLAGKYFDAGREQLKPGGRLVLFGTGSLMPHGALSKNPLNFSSMANWVKLGFEYLTGKPRLDALDLVGKNQSIMGFNLIWLYYQDDLWNIWNEMMEMDLSPPVVGKEFDWEQLPEAMTYFQSGQSIGKVVITVKDEEEK
eukprot:Clim_evm23s237 gene=Clim_evmTU23s237